MSGIGGMADFSGASPGTTPDTSSGKSQGFLSTPILVTRPHHDAESWVQKLRHGGFAAEALPLIEIAPALNMLDVSALQQAWQTLHRYAACMFVSGNAVAYFFKQKQPIAIEAYNTEAINNIASVSSGAWPSGLRFLAPGPGTAAALLAHGVPADRIDAPLDNAAQFDSEALWQVVGQRNWQGCRVLIVRGSAGGEGESAGTSGREWLAHQWQAAGAEVDFLSVYERRNPALSDSQLQRAQTASADGSVWLFSSSQALANLTSQPALQDVNWSRARAIATHPRIAQTVRAAGWGVVVASRPALKNILNTLRSIESGPP